MGASESGLVDPGIGDGDYLPLRLAPSQRIEAAIAAGSTAKIVDRNERGVRGQGGCGKVQLPAARILPQHSQRRGNNAGIDFGKRRRSGRLAGLGPQPVKLAGQLRRKRGGKLSLRQQPPAFATLAALAWLRL